MRTSRFEQRTTKPEHLLALVCYDRDEGALYWLPRPRDMFNNEQSFRTWNTKYAGKRCGSISLGGYRYINGGENDFFYEHRAIWFIENGKWPSEIDHLDGNRTHNRYENMREVDRTNNNRNMVRSKSNTSGVTGVCWLKREQKWRASIVVGYKAITLYCGKNLEQAVAARKQGEVHYRFHPNHGRTANAVS